MGKSYKKNNWSKGDRDKGWKYAKEKKQQKKKNKWVDDNGYTDWPHSLEYDYEIL